MQNSKQKYKLMEGNLVTLCDKWLMVAHASRHSCWLSLSFNSFSPFPVVKYQVTQNAIILIKHFSFCSVSSVAGDRRRQWRGSQVEPRLGAVPAMGDGQPGSEAPDPHLWLPGVAGALPGRPGPAHRGVPAGEGRHPAANWHAEHQAAPPLRHPPGAQGKTKQNKIKEYLSAGEPRLPLPFTTSGYGCWNATSVRRTKSFVHDGNQFVLRTSHQQQTHNTRWQAPAEHQSICF